MRLSPGVRRQPLLLLGSTFPRASIAALVAELLDSEAYGHTSEYLGEYEQIVVGDASVRIRDNADPMYREGDADDERFAFPRYSDFRTIVEIESSGLARQFLERVRGRNELRVLESTHAA